jgi:hypothetical protein
MLSRAALAGFGQATEKSIADAAKLMALDGRGTYEECEDACIKYLLSNSKETNALALNMALDKYSQPMRPGPDLAKNHKTAGQIMYGRQVVKSSKGKHGSNFTPAKKKRKK